MEALGASRACASSKRSCGASAASAGGYARPPMRLMLAAGSTAGAPPRPGTSTTWPSAIDMTSSTTCARAAAPPSPLLSVQGRRDATHRARTPPLPPARPYQLYFATFVGHKLGLEAPLSRHKYSKTLQARQQAAPPSEWLCQSRLTGKRRAAPARRALTRRRCGCTCAGLASVTCAPVQLSRAQREGRALSLAQLEAKHTSLHGHRLSEHVSQSGRTSCLPSLQAKLNCSARTHGHKAAVHARHNGHRLEDSQRQRFVEGAPVQRTQRAGEARCLQVGKTPVQQARRAPGSLELLVMVQHVLQGHCGAIWYRKHYYGMRASSPEQAHARQCLEAGVSATGNTLTADSSKVL